MGDATEYAYRSKSTFSLCTLCKKKCFGIEFVFNMNMTYVYMTYKFVPQVALPHPIRTRSLLRISLWPKMSKRTKTSTKLRANWALAGSPSQKFGGRFKYVSLQSAIRQLLAVDRQTRLF